MARACARGIADPVPAEVLADLDLIARAEALAGIHAPESMGDMQRARQRLVFDELLRIIRELLAQPTEMRLQRVCTIEAFARYVPRSYRTYLRALQERYTAPLAMPELDQILAHCVPPLTGRPGITPKSTCAGGFSGAAPV